MSGSYRLLLDGTPIDDASYQALVRVEVEENCDLPDAVALEFTVRQRDGDLDLAGDARLRPLAPVTVLATPEGGTETCVFEGVVLSHALHLETSVTASRLTVWGQDASWLMNLEEKVREWSDTDEAAVAEAVFDSYRIRAADANAREYSPSYPSDGRSLMQRGTDIQFLRMLARRSGKLCRVTSGTRPGQAVGWFAPPAVDTDPVAVLRLHDLHRPGISAIDVEWDVSRPSVVRAAQALFTDDDPGGTTVEEASSGVAPMQERGLADFAGQPMTVRLTTAVDDAGALRARAQGLLADGGWFARCSGETDVDRAGAVLRANTVVELPDLGSLHSGRWLLWSVRHLITRAGHRMRFVAYRNAVGPGSGGGLP